MNFPPILFNNEKFPSLINQNHSPTSSTITSFQNLCKKLLKYENKESNFEQSITSWIKSLNISQLFKYFSFKNSWLVDILHEMILISNSKPYIKFKFIPSFNPKPSVEKEPQDTKPLISYINFLFFNKESPKFSDYFNIVDEGFVLLTRGKSEGEQRRQELVNNIRYVTLNNGINNYNNKDEEKNYHNEYNNVVTLSYEYLNNIDRLISTFQDISNKQCFKNPIEIETESYFNENSNNNSTKKNYYNFKLPKWLKEEFTFSELFCAYMEQCITINFMYYKMYKSEISNLYFDKFDELIENNKKLIEFIKNSGEKKFEIIRNLRPDEIKKTISESHIKKMICEKNTKDNDIMNSYIGKYSYSKKHTMKTIINSCIVTVEKIFIRGELDFVLFLNFFKDSVIFSTDDFVIKTISDTVNNYWKSKAAEDLLKDVNKNNNINSNEGNNKKRRKKKKKKKEKNEEDVNNHNEVENDNTNDNNNSDMKDNNNLNNEENKIENNDDEHDNIKKKLHLQEEEKVNDENKNENKEIEENNDNNNKIVEEKISKNKTEENSKISENVINNIKENEIEENNIISESNNLDNIKEINSENIDNNMAENENEGNLFFFS